MKGFYISVYNELLDPKHVKNMGESVWLFMWLIDTITSVNENGIGKVDKARPIKSERICAELGVSDKTYRRWTIRLENAGYIRTIRSPYGLVFTVNKAKKIFGGKRTVTNDRTKDDTERSQMTEPDRSKMSNSSVSYDLSNNNKTLQDNRNKTYSSASDLDKTIGSIPEVGGDTDELTSNSLKPIIFNKTAPEITNTLTTFERTFGIKLKRRRYQKEMAYQLVNEYGLDTVQSAIKAVSLVKDERYAPQVLDLQDLWEKWDKIAAYFKRRKRERDNKIAIIEE